MKDSSRNPRTRIYSVVSLVPVGRVTTYGRVAELAGLPGQARQVGYALAALNEGAEIPWHRVINARGEISQRASGGIDLRQRALLESEGVRFDANGRIALSRFGWTP